MCERSTVKSQPNIPAAIRAHHLIEKMVDEMKATITILKPWLIAIGIGLGLGLVVLISHTAVLVNQCLSTISTNE